MLKLIAPGAMKRAVVSAAVVETAAADRCTEHKAHGI
jgi:hypothetical protein